MKENRRADVCMTGGLGRTGSLLALLLCLGLLHAVAAPTPRLTLGADAGWKFLLGDPEGAASPSFADSSWRTVDLPHDWSIEGKPEKDNPTGGGGGFFPAGTGWYRKSFRAPDAWKGKRVRVEFDGVYRDATVYLNGHKLGTQPYGYTSFTLDLTPELGFPGPNVLAVRVNNAAQPNSRWYSGSGIYRHVRVVVTDPVHVAHWGVVVTTPEATAAAATTVVGTKVENSSGASAAISVETTLLNAAGERVGFARSPLTVADAGEADATQTIRVQRPKLWAPGTPVLYRAVTRIVQGGRVTDEVETTFGIRTLSWSAEKGLVLNGKPVKLTGGSVHHDNGPLGAAAFDRAEERKVELLKAAGMNAVRTAHNIPSPAFLDACDRLGLLVLDEPFDAWEAHKVKYDYATNFAEWWKRDLAAMVLRDRNHPSVVIWGIGNEIPELETAKGVELAKPMVDEMHSLDRTRPLTLAFPGTTTSATAGPVFAMLDITGYNYSLDATYAADHEKLPSRLMLTTESLPAKAFPLWAISQDHAYVLGDLTWTAMDYLGESGIGAWSYGTPEEAETAHQIGAAMFNAATVDQMFTGMANGVDMTAAMSQKTDDPVAKMVATVLFHGYPWHASDCGDMDLTGFRKPQSFYRDILWNGGDRVYATVRLPEPEGKKIIAIGWATYPTLASWTWPGEAGKDLEVEVYSGAEKVRLYLNDKLLGEKPTGREQERKAVFSVPYAPGILRAVGLRGDRPVAESVLATAENATALRMTPDRAAVHADGQDLSYITVEAVDAAGRVQPQADQTVEFAIQGPGVIAAVGNGDGQDPASYQGTKRKLVNGRALVVVRTGRSPGGITITAASAGLRDGTATLQAAAAAPGAELQ